MRADVIDRRLKTPNCPELIPVEIVHSNDWFTVKNRGGYFTLEYNTPQVVVLPIVESHSVVMVRAKRPLIGDAPLELPSGGSREKESPVQACARELAEETGIEIQDLKKFQLLPPLSISPNRFPLLPHIYEVHISQKDYELRSSHDEEVIGVESIPLNNIGNMIVRGEIYVCLPIAILSRYLIKRKSMQF